MAEQENTVLEQQKNGEPDYKALYEEQVAKNTKLAKDNANLNNYNTDLKSKYQAKLSDEEKIADERKQEQERYEKLELENKTFKAKSQISKFVKDEQVADKLTNLFVSGDTDNFFKEMGNHFNGIENNFLKQIDEAKLVKNPTPPAEHGSTQEITKEQFAKMGIAERTQLKQQNYELYSKLAKK